ncbi:hypothetical protein [Holdemania sp. Marseille-P2844]|uniref:hypothetical protein n=1 Tax=Holdemania sp. Marseille-P2844 TaxID=1852366 RepID=UPI000932DBDC|nr:hypothetical protein [Holdemania sp. Marseille-P2844]
MKNKEVENCIFDLTQCAKSKYPHDLKVIIEYIEKLERENLGLRQQVENLKRKEESRYKSDAWG